MHNQTKKKLSSRLKRIEGQVRGLARMVGEGAYCIDVISQAQAIKSALSSFEREMLKNHLETHVVEQMRGSSHKKAIDEILKVYEVSQKK